MSRNKQMSSTQELHSNFVALSNQVSTLVTAIEGLTTTVNNLSISSKANHEQTLDSITDLIARIETIRLNIPVSKTTKKTTPVVDQPNETIQEASSDKKVQKSNQTLFKTSFAYECMNDDENVLGPTREFIDNIKKDGITLDMYKYKHDETYKNLYDTKKQECDNADAGTDKHKKLSMAFYKFIGATIYSEMDKTQRANWKDQLSSYAEEITEKVENEPEEPEVKTARKRTSAPKAVAPAEDKPAIKKSSSSRKSVTQTHSDEEVDNNGADEEEAPTEKSLVKKSPAKRASKK